MRSAFAGFLIVGLWALVSGVRADEASDARAIVDKAVQATGGAETLKKFKGLTWKEKGTYYGQGKGQEYTGEYALEWPSRFRMDIKGVFTIVVDGDKGWIKAAGETKEMPKEHLAAHKENLAADYATRLFPLQTKAYTLAPLPEIKIDGKPALGVKASRKGFGDVSLYFDKESGLLAKMEYTAHSPEEKGKEVKQESVFSDYKEVDGMKVPRKFVMKRDGKVYVEAELLEPKPAEKVDAKLFEKP
jgi:outer membrane lipoprotein-sorting protein